MSGLIGFRGDGVKERSRVMLIHIVIGILFEGDGILEILPESRHF